MEQDLQFPTEGVAELTGTEQQIQKALPSYLDSIAQDYDTSRGYYNDVLAGNYDPRTSDFYEGYRAEQDRMKGESQLNIRRQAQKAGIARSTPVTGAQGKVGAQFDSQTLQLLGQLYENERARMAGAAQALPQLSSQYASNLSQAENLAAVNRQVEQAKLSAIYNAALQTMLAPYNMQAQIAGMLLSEQRYAGYTTGGGLTDWGFLIQAGATAAGGGAFNFGGGGGGNSSGGGGN